MQFKSITHPPIDHAQRQADGQRAAAEFARLLPQLEQDVLQYDPLILLAALGWQYALSPDEWSQHDPLLQHHIELLQALFLKHGRVEFSNIDADYGPIEDNLKKLTRLFYQKRYATSPQPPSAHQKATTNLEEQVRIKTQAVRNAGYPHHMQSLITEMLGPIDKLFEQSVGIKGTALSTGFFTLAYVIGDTMQSQLKSGLTDISRPNTLDANMLAAAFPGEHEPQLLFSVAQRLSYPFGALRGDDAERFFMHNPTWTKPFIDLEDGRLFLAYPGVLYSFALDILESLLAPQAIETYKKRRAVFLEEKIQSLFRQYFPSAAIHSGSLWNDGTSQSDYENDLLVVFDRYAFVIEAKSGQIPSSAKRGGDRLKRVLKDLVLSPDQQGKRFMAYLQTKPARHAFKKRNGEVNEVDLTLVEHFVQLNVTFEDTSAISNPSIKDTDYADSSVALAPTIALADWLVLMEILEKPEIITHYLHKRSQLAQTTRYLGDEMDLLAVYLDSGLHLPQPSDNNAQYYLYENDRSIDEYFKNQAAGILIEKPSPKISNLWKAWLQMLRAESAPGWTAHANHLLNVQLADQIAVYDKLIDLTEQMASKDGLANDGHHVIFQNQLVPEEGIAFYLCDREGFDETSDDEIANICFNEHPIERCLVVKCDRQTSLHHFGLIHRSSRLRE